MPERQFLDPQRVQSLGSRLGAKFKQYESERRLAELKWARNARQVLGQYDPDIESQLDPKRSRAYPKITRVKCVSMLARIMNLLFQESDKPWTVEASPVPNLEFIDLTPILQQVDQKAQSENREPTNDEIEAEIRKVANKRAERLELEIEDQLKELGGNRTFDYVALCRKVLMSGIQYGMGVLQGPFIEEQVQRVWERGSQGLMPRQVKVERPRYEFLPIWDYYPDLSAKQFAMVEGRFIRKVMSKEQLLKLKLRPDFFAAQIDKAVAASPGGNYVRRTYETELRQMGVQFNVNDTGRNKFEVFAWEGIVPGEDLKASGLPMTAEQVGQEHKASVWFVNDVVIRAEMDPWVVLAGPEGAPNMFHHFIFEEDESTILGNGLPNIMRDSQMNLCAAVRMAHDNGSIACGMQVEVNTMLMQPGQDLSGIQPNKVWYRDDTNPATMSVPAVRNITIDSHIQDLKLLQDTALQFADQETFIGPATGGDMSRGPSEPFRTAAGASMLRGDAALPFKDVVRNFDVFTQSLIGSMIIFNRAFNKNPDVRGDFMPVARGATSLIAKEVLGIQLDNMAQTWTDEEKMYVDWHEFARARIRVRDLSTKDIIVSDEEARRREADEAQKRQAQAEQQQRMVEAQIRDTLSNVLKNIAQASKNAAGAEATTANVILAALEKGLSPSAIAHETTRGAAGGVDPTQQNGTGGAGMAPAGGASLALVPGGAAPAMPEGPAPGAAGGGEGAGFAAVPGGPAPDALAA